MGQKLERAALDNLGPIERMAMAPGALRIAAIANVVEECRLVGMAPAGECFRSPEQVLGGFVEAYDPDRSERQALDATLERRSTATAAEIAAVCSNYAAPEIKLDRP